MSTRVFLTGLVLLVIVGCEDNKPKFTEEELAQIPFAQRTGLPECSGGLVLAVEGETITSDEVIEPMLEQFRPIARENSFGQFSRQAQPVLEQILAAKISNILLYQKAKKDGGDQLDEALEEAVKAEIRKFIVSFEGDYAKAEEALKQMEMDWASFREYQKKMILSQSYIALQLPEDNPVTYRQLLDCYNQMKDKFFITPAMITFRLIDIEAAKLEPTDPNQNPLEQARRLADELLRRLQAGEDFGQLAAAYSHGHRRTAGGLWKPVQPDSLAPPYDALAAEAEGIEPGQIAGPIEADGHIFIMKLEQKQLKSVQLFEKVQSQLEAKILLDRRRQAINEFSAKLAQQAAVEQRSEFISFCLEKIYRISNQ